MISISNQVKRFLALKEEQRRHTYISNCYTETATEENPFVVTHNPYRSRFKHQIEVHLITSIFDADCHHVAKESEAEAREIFERQELKEWKDYFVASIVNDNHFPTATLLVQANDLNLLMIFKLAF